MRAIIPLPESVDDSFPATLAAARRGAGWAFERLYHDHARHLQGFLRARRAHDPEGTTNEAFRRAFLGIARFEGDGEGQFRSWIFTIARNLLIDEQREHARRPNLVLVPDGLDRADATDTEEQAFLHFDERTARDLLDKLPADQRDVLYLRIVSDLSTEEVAEALGKRPGAVRALQMRGLRRLRRMLDPDRNLAVHP